MNFLLRGYFYFRNMQPPKNIIYKSIYKKTIKIKSKNNKKHIDNKYKMCIIHKCKAKAL